MPPQDNSTGQAPVVDPNAQAPVIPEPQAPPAPVVNPPPEPVAEVPGAEEKPAEVPTAGTGTTGGTV